MEKVKLDSRKPSIMQEWIRSQNYKIPRGFLSFISYYKKFIKYYGNITVSLIILTKRCIHLDITGNIGI